MWPVFFHTAPLSWNNQLNYCVKLHHLPTCPWRLLLNRVLGRNFPFELILWYLHFFIWKKNIIFYILQNSSLHFDTAVLAFSSFMAQAFTILCFHSQPNMTESVRCHPMEELLSECGMVWLMFCLISDKTSRNRFLSHLKCFGYLGVCWKTWNSASERQCLLSFVNWACVWQEWNKNLFISG